MDYVHQVPGISEKVHGLLGRGNPGDGKFNYATGEGYVPATPGAYEKAKMCGCEIALLLFETFGGFGPEMVELLGQLARERENKLFASEYEETTWSARTWTTFAAQKLSVALHYAAATEISAALSVPRFDGAELTAVAAMRGGG